ncbi:MAG: flavodoxin domain-containing protein [Candidatus Enteromonas sp.]|nr:flavodoxin domain-containing protein [Candidatus Enteromonas sp.]
MRTLILYTSKTGGTKKYAEDIASAVGADVLPFHKRKFKKMDLSQYDTIVYGGWVCGSKIQGVDDFLVRYDDMNEKNVILFSSGMGFVSKESRDNMITGNLLDLYHVRYYQLRGSFDYSKLRFPFNWMIKLGISGAKKANDGNTDVDFLERVMETPFEYYDNAGIEKIISILHRLEAEKQA